LSPIRRLKSSTAASRVSGVTSTNSTVSKPMEASHKNCSFREFLKSTPSACTREKAMKRTFRLAVTALFN